MSQSMKYKLRDILFLIEPLADIVVWWDGLDDDEPAYQGSAMDCPFQLSELYLSNGLNDGDCALDVRGATTAHPSLIVSVTDNEAQGIEK